METKWSSLVSHGLTVDALTDFLPLDVTLDVKTVRHDPSRLPERCERSWVRPRSFIEGSPRDWGHLRIPDGPSPWASMVYVRDWEAKKHILSHCRQEYAGLHTDEDEDHPASKRLASCKRGHEPETTPVRGLEIARVQLKPADHFSVRRRGHGT